MKKFIKTFAVVCLSFLLAVSFCACKSNQKTEKNKKSDLWETATYTADTTLGKGENTFVLEVEAKEKTVKFTINTDEKTVGAALLQNKLIAGENGEYGLYVKTVNGITADYDKDKTFWGFYINNEFASNNIDATEIEKDAVYKLVYSK